MPHSDILCRSHGRQIHSGGRHRYSGRNTRSHGARGLARGKDVFVEKPLCLSVDEGLTLVDLAQKHGRILMVGHLLWYHPAILKLKGLIDTGELGRIQYIYSNRLNLGKIRREENILGVLPLMIFRSFWGSLVRLQTL